MKIFLSLLLFTAFSLALWAQNHGDIHKGQTYYKYVMAEKLGYNGIEFTKQYSQKQWEELFSNGAKAFYQTFEFSEKEVTSEMLPHIKAFAVHYANDSKAVPYCGD